MNKSTNALIAGAFRLIAPDEPRMSRAELASAVVAFCGEVDEFWSWIPSIDGFSAFFDLGDRAPAMFEKYRDIDLQMSRGLVRPWPRDWPGRLHDLRAAAIAAGVPIPARAANHLHPSVHAEWNRRLFESIRGEA